MRRLQDKVAIITGASSGIGAAAARLFAEAGAKVVLTARRRDELDRRAAEIAAAGGEAAVAPGDIREAATAQAVVDMALERFGGLDIAFNNAGALPPGAPAHEVSDEDWRTAIEVNLTAAFQCARAQIPAMLARGGGALVFTSTFVGHTVGFPGMAAYAAGKAGLIGLTQVIAGEYGSQGIRANALLPGGVRTPMNAAVAASPETMGYIEGLHALKRIAEPEEIARAALFLASDDASFITGAAVLADGGVSIHRG